MNSKTKFLFCLIVMACSGVATVHAKIPSEGKKKNATAKPAPLSFIENKGQVTDQDHKARTDIQFRLPAANGLNVFIGSGAIHYQFSKNNNPQSLPDVSSFKKLHKAPDPAIYSMYRMDVELVGANTHAKVVTEEGQKYYENYYTSGMGEDGATAHSWNKITYKEVYPNIDWILYTSNGQLKHEFLIRKGGKVSDIQIKYDGATDLKLNADGSFVTTTPMGVITEQAPVSFQKDGKKVSSHFQLNDNILTYKTADYSGDLVIDPGLIWATYHGGTGEDRGFAVAMRGTDSIYFVGYTGSAGSIATIGSYLSTFTGTLMAFYTKYDQSGGLQYATYYGGGSEFGFGIVTDGSGNVYICGGTLSTTGIATGGSVFQPSYAGGTADDGFLVKFNAGGLRQWGTYCGSLGEDYGETVVVDGSGVYMVGQAGSGAVSSAFASAGAHQAAFGGGLSDAFIAKFNTSTGARIWGTFYGGADVDDGFGVSLDGAGNVYFAGMTGSTGNIASSSGVYQLTLGGGVGGWADGFLAKFNASSGAWAWGTYFGGSADDQFSNIVTDGSGNTYAVGWARSTTNIATPGAYQTTLDGGQDALLAKFTSSGGLTWATYYGGNGSDDGVGVAINGFPAYVYISGGTTSTSPSMATSGAFQTSYGGGSSDAFLAMFNSTTTTRLWGTFYGGGGNDRGNCIVKDGSGNLYLVGETDGTAGIATSGAHQTTFGGGAADAFLAKISPCIMPNPSAIVGATRICVTGTATETDDTTGGIWSVSNGNITIGSSSGIVTGVSAGLDTISYTLTNACGTTTITSTIVVLPMPSAIFGTLAICNGATSTLTDTASGGKWTSSNTLVATVGTGSGTVTGVGPGTSTITYSTGGSCTVTAVVTVNNTPAAISGTPHVCIGSSTILTDSPPGGVWTSSNTTVATVAGGTVSGLSAGTTTITYGFGGICNATLVVTVNPLPSAITPSTSVILCVGNTVALSDPDAGGTWSSNNTSLATVSSGGLVTGVGAGVPVISYTTSLGCSAVKSIGVNASPVAIVPATATVCAGHGTSFSDATGGGTWSSSNTSVATVVSGSVTGVAAGTATISYIMPGNCFVTATVTVNPSPAAITPAGPQTVCLATTLALSDATPGGTWSSTSSAIASVGTGGVVTGNGVGTATISYTNGSGCAQTKVITVLNGPTPIVPSGATICAGNTVTFSDAVSGGAWSSANTTIATIGTGGIVTGAGAGITAIFYTIGSCTVGAGVTVNATPAVIAGPLSMCFGNTVTLSDATSAGAWSSSNTSIAVIGAGSGIVTSGTLTSGGTVTISYTKTGCSATTTFTVNPLPAAITGATTVCPGLTTALSDATPAGVWSSANTSLATVSGSGVVTGVAPPGTNISYTTGAGCAVGVFVTVNSAPAAITPSGAQSICTGTTLQMSDATVGGTWSTSNTAIATVTSGGLVSGLTTGVVSISYTNTFGCSVLQTVSVIAAPAAITPSATAVCTGSIINLSDATGGGAWSSNATAIATVSGTGAVTGVSAGVTFISYTIGSCFSVATLSVNATPAAITPSGPVSICLGSTAALTDASGGGIWSSGGTTIATVNSSGVVTGVGTGSVNISYTSASGCFVFKAVTINTAPTAITPSSPAVCAGSSTNLSDAVGGGAWTSSNTSVATISGTGSATGVSAGTTTISYAVGTCGIATTLTVNPLPAAITPAGAVSVCIGGTVSLSDATGGGAWSSGSSTTATVSGTGVVTGVSTGSVNISYTNATGCSVAKSVTVSSTPTAISPIATTVCPGSTIALSDAIGGGVWTSSNTSLATIGSGSGMVTGVASGSLTITYSIGTCTTTSTVTVNPAPSAGTITGPSTVCSGSSISLTDATSGGAWGTSNPTVATVVGGLVTGVGGGTATISYTVITGCGTVSAVATVTVNTSPTVSAISGPSSVCAGTFATLSDSPSGGVWVASNSNATINSSGLLTGVSVGTVVITYTLTTPCGTASTTRTITVGAFLTAGSISGASSVCEASTISLSDPAIGGIWSSSATAVASVGTSGVVTGVGAGTTTISYTVTAVCGSAIATHTVLVNPLPVAGSITGTSLMCAGTVTTMSDAAPGGVWSVTNVNATITGTGLLTGITPGVDTIKYTVTNGCGTAIATKTVTIGTFLTGGVIIGPTSVCVASSITMSDLVTGGIWTSSNGSATIGSTTGLVTGMSAGIDTISYTVSAACGSATSTRTITVNPLPNAGSISGTSSVCVGSTVTLSDAVPAGIWSSSNTANATITSGGVVTAVAAGTSMISYTATNVCGTATATYLINTGLALTAGTITGPSAVCAGSSVALSDAAPGGFWSSANTAVATVGTTGIVTGASAGVDTIIYSMTNVCGTVSTSATITVNPLANPGSISGPFTFCLGFPAALSDAVSGGIWSSSNSNATITSGGLVTPVSVGADTISYSVTNGCGTVAATKIILIGTTPTVSSITGPSGICLGSSVNLSDASGGGGWTSTNTAVAIIGTSGITTGVGLGTSTITYLIANSCGVAFTTTVVTVSNPPAAGSIVGPAAICAGSFTIYTDAAPGGTWSVTNSAATITALGGVLTAITPFSSDTVVYTVTNGCGTAIATKVVNIGAFFSAGTITGPTNVCTGTTIALTDAVAGGIWTSGNGNATVGSSSGIVTGLAAGTDTVYYTVTGACGVAVSIASITISNSPNAGVITGASGVCVGSLVTLSNSVGGGVWGSSNSNATVTTGGVVTGIFTGLDTIRYSVTNSCGVATATKIMTINALPGAGTITGASSVCQGATTTLSDAAGGGVWSSTNTAIAKIGTTGIVTGMSGGTTSISYSVTNGCGTASTTFIITVNPFPNPGGIVGADTVCVGATINLTDAVSSGVWSAGNANATVSGAGVVTGVTLGTTPISYSVTNGCGTSSAVKIVFIDDIRSAGTITGPSSVCVGSGITLFDAAPGGIWLTANSNAVVVGPGVIDGVTVGVDTVFYAVTNGCGTAVASKIIPVNPVPFVAPISGITSECVGSITNLSDAVTGGVWTSSNPAVAAIGVSTGIVSGLVVGTATITYTVTNGFGCPTSVTANDTVLATPGLAAITGSSSVCAGASIFLNDTDPGGLWISGNTATATINSSTGLITGVAPGVVTISYSIVNICGSATVTRAETVNPAPAITPITGSANICVGSSVALSDATAGGVWISSNSSVATVGTTGIVSGASAGTSTIIYTVTNVFGCSSAALQTETVNPLPAVAGIAGTTNECIGATTTLGDATLGGVWSSGNTLIATVGSSSGIVMGVAAGSTFIIYSVTDGVGCTGSVAVTDTVNGPPSIAAISGPASVCVSASVTLTDATVGGVWTSSNANATVAGGVVTGVTSGADTIIYSVTGACGTASASAIIAINTVPVVTAIAGSTNVCVGGIATLTDAVGGGLWSTSDLTVGIGSASGVVTGVSVGTALISYSVTNTCGTTSVSAVETVITLPDPGVITGASSMCPGASITLSDAVAGGIWSASNTRATVLGSLVTGVTPGADTIMYSVTNACGTSVAAKAITVSPLPNAGAIYGPSSVCMGHTINVTDGAGSGMWSSSAPLVATVNGVGLVTPVGPGMTNIIYTVTGACGTGSSSHVVSVISAADCNGGSSTGVANVVNIVELKVFPNPNRGTFNMNLLSDNKEQVQVIITNVIGQKVKEFTTATNNETEIKLDQPAGVYILTAIAGDRRYIEKVTVE